MKPRATPAPRPKKTPARKAPAAKPPATRAGAVALLGAPNAGKSTLLNGMVGEKLSIVSPKAQTTRTRVLGLVVEGTTQMGLLDTPGLFAPKRGLDRAMVQAAWAALDESEAALLLVDASSPKGVETSLELLDSIARRKRKILVALNKVDQMKRPLLLPLAERFSHHPAVEEIFMISALTGDGVAELKKRLLARMPEGPWLFPADQLTDMPQRVRAAEITREHAFRQLHQEIPYGLAVVPEVWEEGPDGALRLMQTILVARPGHKAMVVGAGGSRIKAIGTAARNEMEDVFGCDVHLFLNVRVEENWQDSRAFYELFGLETPPRKK